MAIIDGLNKVFESKIRLGIMSVLVANGSADFATLKSLLELTDGNLASHTRNLEEVGYIRCEKKFIGRKPNTTYVITEEGREAFAAHIAALERFLKECRS
ncbi:MAG: transcriptional regulator [Bacteroidales bacterium]|jgi:DNA-binding MarR family transcriptional regulator|nr:transcriptional regulator [Bacteroidales bacterium]